MKSAASFVVLLFAVLLGVGIALIRPAQPVQVGMKASFVVGNSNGLDNDAILVDSNIQPARKCTSLGFISRSLFHFFLIRFRCCFRPLPPYKSLGGFCMGVSIFVIEVIYVFPPYLVLTVFSLLFLVSRADELSC